MLRVFDTQTLVSFCRGLEVGDCLHARTHASKCTLCKNGVACDESLSFLDRRPAPVVFGWGGIMVPI